MEGEKEALERGVLRLTTSVEARVLQVSSGCEASGAQHQSR
jgi:hypothetical protein